jgi:hypothetical protein
MPDTQLPENNICHEGQRKTKSNIIIDWLNAYDHHYIDENGRRVIDVIVPIIQKDES